MPSLTPRLRTLLATAANAPGVPRGALRVAHQRLDDAERGILTQPPEPQPLTPIPHPAWLGARGRPGPNPDPTPYPYPYPYPYTYP